MGSFDLPGNQDKGNKIWYKNKVPKVFLLYPETNVQNLGAQNIILTLNRPASDHSGVWPSRGAGPFTSEIPQTVRDSTSLSAQH